MGGDWRGQAGQDQPPDVRAQARAGVAAGASIPLIVPDLRQRRRNVLSAIDVVALGNGEARYIALGNSSAITVWNVRQSPFLTYGIITQKTAMLIIETAFSASGPWSGWLNYNLAAGVFETPYTLPSPYNRNGFLLLQHPFLRIEILDTASAAHTYTRLAVTAWHQERG